MAKPWILPTVILSCSGICLLVGILVPIILTILQRAQIKDSVVLTKANHKNEWGKVPGDMDVLITQHYRMFNMTNPDDFLNGAPPSLVELNGYKYQEFDEFLNVSYGDSVEYALIRYAKRTSKLPWSQNVSDQDLITTVSVGAFGGWYLVKHYTREQLSLIALALLAGTFENDLPIIAYSIAIRALIVSEKAANLSMFVPAGLTPTQGSSIWNDPIYGMNNRVTLQFWIRALQENLNYENEFILNIPYTSTLNTLRIVFGLSDSQLALFFSGQFLSTYQLTALLLYNSYDCSDWSQQEFTCDPIYLAGTQWASSEITRFPPAIPPLGPSVTSINDTVPGYPEIYYYYQATGLGGKIPNYEFTPEVYLELFDYDRTTGYPSYSNYSLLDVTHMKTFYQLGWQSDFVTMGEQFNLSPEGAQILWDYVNAIVDFTALQFCYDTNVYNFDNRGLASEAALGQAISPTLFNFTTFLANYLLINITTVYDYLRFEEQGINCSTIINALTNFPNICKNYALMWQDGGLGLWIQVYWNGVNSSYWNQFAKTGRLSYAQMQTLFSPTGSLVSNLIAFDIEIKQHYNCSNSGNTCNVWFLANKQWGQSYVTLNLPGILAKASIENSTSITNYPFLKGNYSGTPEFGAFALSKGYSVLTNDSLINSLLCFTGLYSPPVFQLYFIQVFARNNTAITELFGVTDPDAMTAYLRFFADKYFLGGLIRAKTVQDILFTDIDPLTLYNINLSPLAGGNPAMYPGMSQVGLNFTKEFLLAPGKSFRSKINAGKHDTSDLRKYKKILGASYINMAQQFYNGQLPDGSQNITWIHFNPWNGTAPAKGCDAWQFHPFIDTDDHLYYYLDIGAIMFKLKFNKHKTYKGYNVLEYVVDNGILQNQSVVPENAVWFQNTLRGLTNQTGVFIAPVFGSKPYFYSGDELLNMMVDFQYPQMKDNRDLDESQFYVEPNTGMVLKGRQLLQYNLEIRPDVLYPNLGKQNIQMYGRRTYLPFVIYDRYADLKQHKIDDKIGMIKLVPKIALTAQIVGYTLFGVLLLNGIYLVWRRRKSARSTVGDDRLLDAN